MPRNYVTVTGNVLIDGVNREKDIHIFDCLNGTTTLVGKATSNATTGAYSATVLKERDSYLLGMAVSDYGSHWLGSKAYTLGQKVLPLTSNGYWYECTVAGTSGLTEPNWTGAGDFTVEAWIYPTITSANGTVFAKSGSANSGFSFYVKTGGALAVYNGVAELATSPGLIQTNTWTHVAWSMRSGTLKMYINGVEVTSAIYSITPNTHPGTIGVDLFTGAPTNAFTGYVDSFRITKSAARYDGDFAPPLTMHPSPRSSDAFYASVKSLMQFNGFDGQSTFMDEVPSRTWAKVGTPTLDTSQVKYGGTSVYFPGESALTTDTSSDFDTVGDWTIECWARFTGSNSTPHLFEISGATTNFRINLFRTGGSTLNLYTEVGGSGGVRLSRNNIFNDVWHHFALSKDANGLRFYVDGQYVGVYTGPLPTGSLKVRLGSYTFGLGNDSMVGWVDDFRYTCAARYTDNFTPTINAEINDITTSLLEFEGGATTDSVGGNGWIANGSAATTSSLAKVGTSSLALDGTGDYLSLNHNTNLNIHSSSSVVDGTVEWTYRGVTETPVSRGPFFQPDPTKDPNVVHLVRYQEWEALEEVSSSKPTTIYGSPRLITNITKWQGKAITFDQSYSSAMEWPISATLSGDWTVEAWVYMTAIHGTDRTLFYVGRQNNSAHRIQFDWLASGKIEAYAEGAGGVYAWPIAPNTMSLNAWHHIAFTRSGNNFYLHIDGTMVQSATGSFVLNLQAGSVVSMGGGRFGSDIRYSSVIAGEHRISNIARYGAGNFSVPTGPYTL